MSGKTHLDPQESAFPALPTVVEELVHLSSFTTGRGKLQDLLCRDAQVAEKIVALANLVCPPSFPAPINELGQAVLALDARTVKGLALCIPLAQIARFTFPLLSPVRFWRHALLTALTARRMAATLGIAHPEDIFMGALLHDVGIALLIKRSPRAFAELALPWTEGSAGELREEQAKLESTHPETGYDLSIHWRLPVVVGACIRHHHAPPDQLRRDIAADVRGAISVVQYADASTRYYGHSLGKFDLVDPSHPPTQEGITLTLTGAEAMVRDLAKKVAEVVPVFFEETAAGVDASEGEAFADRILEASFKLLSLRESLLQVSQVSERKAIEFNQLLLDLNALGQDVKEFMIPPEALTPASTLFLSPRKAPSRAVLPGNYLPRELLVGRIDAVLAKLQATSLRLERSIA